MNEFEFRPDRTTDYGVSCPWASKKYPHRPYNGENGVSTFSLLFLIGSFWYFHGTRTSIKAWMSSNFLKWDLTLAHWTQVSVRCPLGYLLLSFMTLQDYLSFQTKPFQIRDENRKPTETTFGHLQVKIGSLIRNKQIQWIYVPCLLILPCLFEVKRGDIVFGFPSPL